MNGYKTKSENIEYEIAPIKKSRFIVCIAKVANHREGLN
ncbi:YigZ family protein, partial [Francisella tularensis subsp. holarctica]|nr:YigZ family protein [Francisella tularensis subsp. holarctica]